MTSASKHSPHPQLWAPGAGWGGGGGGGGAAARGRGGPGRLAVREMTLQESCSQSLQAHFPRDGRATG